MRDFTGDWICDCPDWTTHKASERACEICGRKRYKKVIPKV